MLFRNLRTGNIVAASDETAIELMNSSDNYVAIYTSDAVEAAPVPKKAVRKTAKAKNGKTE